MTIISENTSTKYFQCIKYNNSFKESHSCEKMQFYTYFPQKYVIESIARYHYSLILWYFEAKSNIIFSFHIKLLATFDHMRDRKNSWE